MFRDLKEYQKIQEIYQEKIHTLQYEDIISESFEKEKLTVEEAEYILENLDILLAEEESSELNEEVFQEDITPIIRKVIQEKKDKGVSPSEVGMGLGMKKTVADKSKTLKKSVKNIGAAVSNVKKFAGNVASSARKKFSSAVKNIKANPKAGKLLKGAKNLAKGAAKVAMKNKKVAAAALAVGGTIAAAKAIKDRMGKKKEVPKDEGPSFADSIKANTPEMKGTVIQDTIKNTETKPTPPKSTEQEKPKKKMGQIEKDNRQRFGDKRIDFLKQKQKDFKARRKGEMSKDDFNKKYPKSQSAKDAYARKNPNSSQAMQNMSYQPEGTPIQETSGYDPIKNYHLANDLAKVYQNIYEPAEESLAEDVQNYNALVEFIINEKIVSTVEEADAIIVELDSELVEGYLTEGVISEGLMDAVKRVAGNVGSAVKSGAAAVGSAAGGAVNKAKQVVSNVKDKVKTAVQTKVQQGRDIKSGGVDKLKQGNQLRDKMNQKRETLKTQSSGGSGTGPGMSNDPGKTRAQIQFLKNKREKMNNPNQKQLSGAERAKQMAKERLAAKESVEKDAYTVVLEYLLDQKHATSIEEANYIMTELDTETIQGIISES